MAGSPFLQTPRDAWVANNDLSFAIRDIKPLFPGHTLVVPFRDVPDWWQTTDDERLAIFALVDVVRSQLLDDAIRAQEFPGIARPDGFNVGFNAGLHAGQTVFHLHVHVIPRYADPTSDPRKAIIDAVRGNEFEL